jgi:hypothetical protein
VGGRLPRRDQARQRDLLEHAQLHHNPDGRLRLRSQKRRARLQKVGVSNFKMDDTLTRHPLSDV